MRVETFDFALPKELVALRPAEPREAARLLVCPAEGALEDRRIGDLPELLRSGDLLVLNDTKVIWAALRAQRPARDAGGASVEVSLNLIKREGPACWRALARPGKRLREGDTLVLGEAATARVLRKEDAELVLMFDREGCALDALIADLGAPPLPPYIAERRAPDLADKRDYQTIYAREEGSVAAPTAGIHLTEDLLGRLAGRGVETCFVTLHVGAGTFLPVKVDDVDAHRMHAELRTISAHAADAITCARREGRRVIAVGTTALRAIESAVDDHGRLVAQTGETTIFIRPGRRILMVDGLLTNFHLPRSTLFMLVCAFSGVARMQSAYAHAVAQGYRFFSYGDANLLWRA
jgi:S-adenosylmethionine:tRNA ribosyltransferase-isomerase